MQYVKGPLLVLGGAGSGKTSLLATKIAWLIREYDVSPSQIVVLATRPNSVRSLRACAEDYAGRKLPMLPVLSFMEFGLQLMEPRLQALGLQPGFSLYDRSDCIATISRLLRETQPQTADLAGAVAEQIAEWKRSLTPPTPAPEAPATAVVPVAAWIYRRYEQRLRAANAIDVDDIVRKAVRLFTSDAAFLTQWRDRVRFLLVDEYENNSTSEHELVRLLVLGGVSLTAAGNGARTVDRDNDSVERLRADLSDLRVVTLEQNFRCSARIAVAASRIAGAARSDFPADTARGPGVPLRVMHSRNEQQEAEGIAAALAAHQARSDNSYPDFAVLLRYLEQAPPLEQALRAQRVPYHVHGAPSFFEQPEVRDLWSYLRLLCNPADDGAFLRALNTPRRDIAHATLERLGEFAADRGRPLLDCALDAELTETLAPIQTQTLHVIVECLERMIDRAEHADPTQLVRDVVAELHYADWLRDTCNDAKIAAQRMNNVTRMIAMLQRFARRQPEVGLRSIITRLNLHAILYGDEDELANEGVTLLTFDAAYGTEFAHVYIVGFEEGILPAPQPNGDLDIASERQLAYRIVTRARDSVTFTITEQRRLAGGISARRASRFLTDLPPQDVEWTSSGPSPAFAENSLANSATYIDRGGRPLP